MSEENCNNKDKKRFFLFQFSMTTRVRNPLWSREPRFFGGSTSVNTEFQFSMTTSVRDPLWDREPRLNELLFELL